MKTNDESVHARRSRLNQERKWRDDPCVLEHDIVLKCFDDKNYDHKQCSRESDNYRLCKRFWAFVSADRIKKRVFPGVPPPEDREQVKQEYLAKGLFKP